jgi:hypothetical protein
MLLGKLLGAMKEWHLMSLDRQRTSVCMVLCQFEVLTVENVLLCQCSPDITRGMPTKK